MPGIAFFKKTEKQKQRIALFSFDLLQVSEMGMKIPILVAGKDGVIGEADLHDCFFNSAQQLYASAYDGIIKSGRGGCLPAEFFQGYFLVAFYLYRHAFELVMKKLASMLNISKKTGHKLSDLWDEILRHPSINQL